MKQMKKLNQLIQKRLSSVNFKVGLTQNIPNFSIFQMIPKSK